jgi:hypothetical protein
LKKSIRVGLSGIAGSRGSAPMKEMLAGVGGEQRRAAVEFELAVGHLEQHRLGADVLMQSMHHLFFRLVGAFRERQRSRVFVHCQPAFPVRVTATDSIASTIAWYPVQRQ